MALDYAPLANPAALLQHARADLAAEAAEKAVPTEEHAAELAKLLAAASRGWKGWHAEIVAAISTASRPYTLTGYYSQP